MNSLQTSFATKKINFHLYESHKVKGKDNCISTLELRRLFLELKEKPGRVGVRFRLIGKQWNSEFITLVDVNEKGAAFSDASTDGFIHVPALSDIMQVEIDTRHDGWKANFVYDVIPVRWVS